MQLINILKSSHEELVANLWQADMKIKDILSYSPDLKEAREKLFNYLNNLERHYFNIHSDKIFKELHIIEKNNAKECIRVFKNLIRTENEQLTGFSALKTLKSLSGEGPVPEKISKGFLSEFIFLFHGINGRSGITDDKFVLPEDSHEASRIRSAKLDEYADMMNDYLRRFPAGNTPEMELTRKLSGKKIMKLFGAGIRDWKDYRWQLKHVIQDSATLQTLVHLEPDEIRALTIAEKNHIPFHITPYYLSLFNPYGRTRFDRPVRAQVLPSQDYCEKVAVSRGSGVDMDFMGEKSTSPIEGVTRRYPHIVILKPVDTCPQICVYCQRNWEIKPMHESHVSRKTISRAIDWIRKNKLISEVLITGGDPFILPDDYLEALLDDLSQIKHIERIRIGTRVLVTLPFRITSGLVSILKRYHEPGTRELCIVTHFEHPVEITGDSLKATARLRNAGLSIYNQQVFTYYNSARFETAALRKSLKLAGIDPYYTFNTKGKEETLDFRVPIARIEQERKEEARFLPGIVRTDEPVFNVPKLGKSHLRAWQDHELIMILPDGQRAYRFYPWESKVTLVDDYIYYDVPILNYLERLNKDGENPEDFKSLWYYF